jgi:hypothetical protein
VFGGQQFRRLVQEFELVCSKVNFNVLHDVSLRDDRFALRAVADSIQMRARELFEPLLEQLFKRAVFVLKNTGRVVQQILAETSRPPAPWSAKQWRDFPQFVSDFRENYFASVDEFAARFAGALQSEFFSAQTLYWMQSLTSFNENDVVSLFGQFRARLIASVQHKMYNLLLMPIQRELWAKLQGHVASLSDVQLEDLFSISAMRSVLLLNYTKFDEHNNDLINIEELIYDRKK